MAQPENWKDYLRSPERIGRVEQRDNDQTVPPHERFGAAGPKKGTKVGRGISHTFDTLVGLWWVFALGFIAYVVVRLLWSTARG